MEDIPDFPAERLRAFLAVARAPGFSRGAALLGRSQSSVSQAVRALEEELREPLFVRDGRVTRMTEAGSVLLRHTEAAFAELARAREALLALRAVTSGTVRLGTSDTLATYLLPPVFARFRKQYPQVELALDNRPSPVIAERVAGGNLDLGIVSLPLPKALRIDGKPADDALRTQVVARLRDVLICPKGHRFGGRSHVHLRELAGEPLVLLDRTTASRALYDESFAELSIRPNIAMEMSSVEVLKRMVELGFGLSIVPELSVRRELRQGTLLAVRLRGVPSSRSWGLITPTAGAPSHAARAFLSVLADVAAERVNSSKR